MTFVDDHQRFIPVKFGQNLQVIQEMSLKKLWITTDDERLQQKHYYHKSLSRKISMSEQVS
jgi:hypothetical protein